MRKHTWLVGTLLFGSGGCALVYQIGWLREFRLIFGASTEASAAVLAIFIGGLGLGGLLVGRRADAHPRPLLLYAQLEAVVALSAAATPALLWLAQTVYLAVGGTPRLGLTGGTIGRLVLGALVLAVPTISMGGTLPAAARSVTQPGDRGRRDVAALYALNTLGAVVGCLAATFFLLEIFGTRATLWLAAAVNLIIAIVARQLDRNLPSGAAASAIETAPERTAKDEGARESPAPAWFVLTASAVVGFAFLLMEIVWYRMLGPLLGGSVFTFGLILATALAGIGLGSLWYALAGRHRPATLTVFTWICVLEAAVIALPFALGDRLALFALVLRSLARLSFTAQVVSWALVSAVVVLPAAVVAGYQFPLLIAMRGLGREKLGRQIGAVYASNTVGAIAGSLAGGFGLLPWLSAPGTWRFSAASLLALALSALALSWRRGARLTLLAPFAFCMAIPVGLLSVGPTAVWRHSGIGAGRARVVISSWNQMREWTRSLQRAIVWDEDGTESSVALGVEPSGFTFIVNGKADGSARGDAGTQVMLGLLGAILKPDARRSLVIGLGTGSTAGWLGAVPSMAQVDVVELEPLILDIARACDEVNLGVLRNPKIRIAIGDARETLRTSRQQYDLIASEPSNPFRAGVASLFTQEYYEAASRRLTEGGVFLQWVQLYEVDARTLRTVYATIASVFPHVEAWEAGGSDLVLVGSGRPLTHRADALAARMHEEPFRTALQVAWRAVDLNGLLAHFVANERLAPLIAQLPGVEINTDDRNVVEFGFARSVGTDASLLVDLKTLARSTGHERPRLADAAAVDWNAVDTAWVAYQSADLHLAGVEVQGPPAEQARQAALILYYRDTDLAGARAAWQQQAKPPSGPTEWAMLADLEAEAGSEATLASLQQLRRYQPGEADVILATLRFRQARFDDAAAALESAFENFRTSPWALNRFKQRGVALAGAVATRSPQLAARMVEALKAPWALRAMQDERLVVAATLTRRVDFAASCRDAVGALEPHAPWTLSFLTLRRDCYEGVDDPRLALAADELRQFMAHDPMSLRAGF